MTILKLDDNSLDVGRRDRVVLGKPVDSIHDTITTKWQFYQKRPRTIVTYLFLWTRYSGIAFLICSITLLRTAWYTVTASLGTLNIWVVEFLRLYALYNCSHRFTRAAKYALGLQLLMMSGYGVYALWTSLGFCLVETKVMLDGFIYCEILNRRTIDRAWIFWILLGLVLNLSSFDAVVLTLTIQKALHHHHMDVVSIRLTNLTSTLLWDSIAYSVLGETMMFWQDLVLHYQLSWEDD
ncbi:hypothetical protein F5887DRAFT_924397 [Amanita rubescens]|nr:hypothetical protein F5887DRAFT_924397 [Amanita rubescens]